MKKKYAIVKVYSYEKEDFDNYGDSYSVFTVLLPMHITEWEEMEEDEAEELKKALEAQANIRKQKKKGGKLKYPEREFDSLYLLVEQQMLTNSEKVNTIQEFKDFHLALEAQFKQEEDERKRKAEKAKKERAAKRKAKMEAEAEKKIAALEKELEALKRDK